MKDEKWFWSVIEQSQKASGLGKLLGRQRSFEQQIDNLTKILSSLSPDDIREFDLIFHRLLIKSYTWELWGAVYVINGGCSDDTFDYFRAWLIGQGEQAFYNAIQDPESLKDIVKQQQPDGFEWEGLEYCAGEAYEAVTGKQLQHDGDIDRPSEPQGKEWSEDELPSMFPELWKKFSHDG